MQGHHRPEDGDANHPSRSWFTLALSWGRALGVVIYNSAPSVSRPSIGDRVPLIMNFVRFFTSWEAASRGRRPEMLSAVPEFRRVIVNSEVSSLTVSQSAFSPRLRSFFHVIQHFQEEASLLREAVCM